MSSKRLMILASLILSLNVKAENADIYYVKGDKNQAIDRQLIGLPKDSSQSPIVGSMDQNLLGICLKDSECKINYPMGDRMNANYAKMNGLNKLPASEKIPMSNYSTDVTTVVKNRDEDKIQIESKMSLLGSDMELKKYDLENLKLTVDFQNTDQGPNRKDYSEVDEKSKALSNGVFQILIEGDDGLGATTDQGTGFFISKDGYAMTNLHVLGGSPECIANKKCTLKIKFKDSKVHLEEVLVSVLTCSKKLDFCLFKIDNDQIVIKEHFDINLGSIPKELLSLGYPGDKERKFEDSDEKETALTYTCGSPIGTNGVGITTSLYIYGGASGSPVLDKLGKDVFGILSNGTGANRGNGMPGLFRPLALINKFYGVDSYLNSEKQNKIDKLILNISSSDDVDSVKSTLATLAQERSYYGIDKLEQLSYEHKNIDARRIIFNFLKNFSPDAGI